MKFEWVKKVEKHEHEFEGYPNYTLGISTQVGRLKITFNKPKYEVVDRCKICGKTKSLTQK